MSCKLEDFCVATFLDPRYKKLEFKNLANCWESGTLTKDTVLKWARAAYDADWKPKAVDAPLQVVGSVAAASKPKLVTFMSDSEDEDDGVVVPSDTHATQVTDEDVDEFSLYSSLKPCKKKCEDSLEWWVERKHKLPNLFRMVRQFLAPPASTAGVERAFTTCGQMHSDLKKRITEGTLEHSMMVSMNTK
ncbi:hypothetical protein CYMTET_10480 [Cymbomonas tetramitiformis]|uniref:HAT C-terminal dimerisation domain-containing protein n=1 Tax=Cymbomonas tetramitiformis TaxID=36881 RepID=A0AAE0LDT6_9CHLO|nr:hypothetical protein CYMTET_10480 [Cymbomonas tetramitiformis]